MSLFLLRPRSRTKAGFSVVGLAFRSLPENQKLLTDFKTIESILDSIQWHTSSKAGTMIRFPYFLAKRKCVGKSLWYFKSFYFFKRYKVALRCIK